MARTKMTAEAQDKFERLVIAARYWLLGMAESNSDYYKVIAAMEICRKHHDGVRNGGEPEAIHMFGIFHHLRTMHRHIKNPTMVYSLAFLHDAIEDPNQRTKAWVTLDYISAVIGEDVAEKLKLLSKSIHGQPNTEYSLDKIFSDVDCSIVKAGDRVNNVSSMVGVFKPERLERYVKETREEFIPRIKEARRMFPFQEPVYENMKLELVNQLTLIERIMGDAA